MKKQIAFIALFSATALLTSCDLIRDWHGGTPAQPKLCAVKKITVAPGKVIEFTYNATGKIASSTLSPALQDGSKGLNSGTWTFQYDAAGRLDKVVGANGNSIDVTANADGHVTGAALSVANVFVFSSTLAYDASKRITSFRYSINGGRTSTDTYTYTPSGNLTDITRLGAGPNNFSLKPTAYDNQTSLWNTSSANNIIYWWLVTVNNIQINSALTALSYQNNVTKYDYVPLSLVKEPYTVGYTYANAYPATLSTQSASGGTVASAIEYICK